MEGEIQLGMHVNGRRVEVRVEPRETLLDVLRNRLGLTGTKRSCDMEVCGACTVLLDGAMVSACTLLAYEAREREVLTIEGLADGERLHPIQESFIEHGGLQCGFCTPGMIMASRALLEENPRPTVAEVTHFLRGNICRCTGYKKIVESILAAAERMAAPAESGAGGA
jgi:carbon-monoxide dehydrogenase small subunit